MNAPSPSWASSWRPIALLLLATALVFLPALGGDFVWDDTLLIVDNQRVRAPQGLGALLTARFTDTSAEGTSTAVAYWRPFITAVWALQWRLFGAHPAAWHAVNLALHLALVGLVYRWLLARIAPDAPDAVSAHRGALLGAALFALHPTRPESVAWIAGSTDLWAALFELLALHAWARATRAADALAAALLVLGLACKESTLAVPAALAVDHALRARPVPWRRLLGISAPMAAVFAMRLQWVPLPTGVPTAGALDLPLRVLSSLGHAVRLTVAPYPPSVFAAPGLFDAAGAARYAPWSVALGVTALGVMVGLAVRARHVPARRPALADLAFALVLLGPALNVVPLGLVSLFAMRFLYLPLLGVAALVARAVAAAPPTATRTVTLAALGGLVVSALVSFDHVGDFTSDEALWTRERELNPALCFTHAELATVRARQRRLDEALQLEHEHFRCAVGERSPQRTAQAAHAVAERLAALTPDADQATLTAVAVFLRRFEPGTVGGASLHTPRVSLSVALDDAARRDAWPAVAPFLATVEARTLDYDRAEQRLRSLVAVRPRDPIAWRNLAALLATRARWDEALAACDMALALLPSSAPPAIASVAHRARA